MRVLMLSKACIVGIYQRKLEEIAKQGVELLTLVPPSWRDERGETMLERAHTEGYRLEVLPIRFNGSYHLHHYSHLWEKMRKFRPHLVHIDEEPYNAATWQALYCARKLGVKSLFFTWQNIARRYPFPFNVGERWVLNTTDAAIAGTEGAAQVWRAKGYRREIAVIPQFGTDPHDFTPSEQRPQRPFTVGFVGRLVEEKGVQVLLQALVHLRDRLRCTEWRLVIIGGGPLKNELQAQVERNQLQAHVDFAGQFPSVEMPAQYQAMDALVLPSLTRPNWKEQFGRALVEAMASGVPVIGSDSGAIPDVIGDAGLIVPEGNTRALAEALYRLMNDSGLYAQLWQAGRQRMLDHFTHEQVAAATVAFYRRIMG
ncbi:MAG: glycosyltransferase [bacterium]|nr:glycosyltransferase [bacterium]